jgi:hypothetical protein
MITKGIKLDITSWENDADHYKTISLNGLSEETAKFFVEFANLFTSGSNNNGKTYGNAYDSSDVDWVQLRKDAKVIFAKYPNAKLYDRTIKDILTEIKAGCELSDDELKAAEYPGECSEISFICDIEYKLFGESAEDRVFRVFESFKAFYIPEDIPEINLN